MKKPGFREKWSYRFDRMMARGTVAMVLLLFGITAVVANAVALLTCLIAPDIAGTITDSIWNSYMHVLDAGTIAADYTTRHAGYITLMVLAGVCGLFVTSILIGIITMAFQKRLEGLRHGNARVLENGHTLIIGHDEHLSTVLHELTVANENRKNATVVVLCNRDRCLLETMLCQEMTRRKPARVICREGDPTAFPALRNVGIEACSRVIALGNNDFEIIKEILAANTLLNECGVPDSVSITAMITQEQNLDAAHIAGGQRLELLYFEKLIARIFAQTCRQAGLSQVYQELFDFEGDEIYMEKAPALAGKLFSEAALYYRKAALMGVKRDGKALLNPPGNTAPLETDEMIVIAADSGVGVPETAPGLADDMHIHIRPMEKNRAERILILGFNRLTDDIITEISAYAIEGSSLTVASERIADGNRVIGKLAVRNAHCDQYDRRGLESLLADHPDCVIVLAEEGEGDADARTLTLLLQLSHFYRDDAKAPVVVSEMLSKKNQALATCAHVNDFVIGTNLASLVLTQVAQNRLLNPLFDELLTDAGSEIFIKPVDLFVETGVEMNLYTLTAAAAQTGQMLLGLRLRREDGGFEVRINPDKETRYQFTEKDCAIVLAVE